MRHLHRSGSWDRGMVCVCFNRKIGEFVARVTTDAKGQFEFSNIAHGEYVLIVFAGDLQKVIIPIQLTLVGKANKPRRLQLPPVHILLHQHWQAHS